LYRYRRTLFRVDVAHRLIRALVSVETHPLLCEILNFTTAAEAALDKAAGAPESRAWRRKIFPLAAQPAQRLPFPQNHIA